MTVSLREHALTPRLAGPLPGANGIGISRAAASGARGVTLKLLVRVEGGRVAAARFQAFGCGFSMAAGSAAAELADGAALEAVRAIGPDDIAAAAGGLPEHKRFCAELASTALAKALDHAAGPAPPASGTELAADTEADADLFRRLLALGLREPPPEHALGLDRRRLEVLAARHAPGVELPAAAAAVPEPTPEMLDLERLLLEHRARDVDEEAWLATIVARRAQEPRHLWEDLGLADRRQLSRLLSRFFPTLASKNVHDMKWKRFLYKQLCDRAEVMVCKAPNCAVCDDVALCFGPEG